MKRNLPTHLSNGYEVSVAQSVAEVEGIRPIWEQMQSREPFPVVNADIDRYLSVLKASGDSARPYILLFRQRGEPNTMVIARLEKHMVECKIGYKVIWAPSVCCLTVVYGGILGARDTRICTLIVRELLSVLHRREADMVFFSQLKTDSIIYRKVRTLAPFVCLNHLSDVGSHRSMTIPASSDEFYHARSKKHKKHLRQYIAKLDKECEGDVKLVTYSKEEDLDEVISVISKISRTTYQYAINKGVVNDSFTRTLMNTAAERGWFRAYVLYASGEPCAFRLALHYAGTYFGIGIGYDPKWSNYRVGTILFIKVLDKLCSENTVHTLDFGFGDADYKRSYGDTLWQETSVYIFAPRPYPVIVNVLQTATVVLNASLRYVTNKARIANWVKRCWRNSLQVTKNNKHKTGVNKP